ncbi:MAG: DUF2169 domain-containing protein [Pseudomonadota bacterium]
MPLVIKPRSLALLHKVERRRSGARFIAAVVAAFDLADSSAVDSEQALWPMLAASLPEGAAVDMCMPKPRAELLIGGRLTHPDQTGMFLEAELAGIRTSLAVFGNRWWVQEGGAYVATKPQSISDLLLGPQRAFGGEGHPANPVGLGFNAVDRIGAGAPVALPNVERPDALIHSILDVPPPAQFGPMDIMAPERQRLAGTYDAAWLRDVAPALADDIHPDFFLMAPPGQRFWGHLVGDEPYRLRNFSASAPLIEGRLPGLRPRAFVGQTADRWSEMELALDTVWFMAGARRGVLVWHGVLPVDDIEGKDVSDVMLAYERLDQTPRPIAHYADVRRVRCDPDLAPRYAFSEWQLTPPRDPAEEERRRAARRAKAERGAALHAEMMAFMTTRALDKAGVPEALRPAAPGGADPDPLLLPTEEDLAEGDFDLGDLLDQIEAKTTQATELMRRAAEKGQPVLDAMARLHAHDAGESELDALLTALQGLDGGNLSAALDGTLGGQAISPKGLEEEAASSPVLSAALEQARNAQDWRSALLAGLKPEGDETLLEQAKARFLHLPEASPLAAARAGLADLAKSPLPALPDDFEEPPPQSLSSRPISDLLAQLDAPLAEKPEARAEMEAKLAAADSSLRAALPALGAEGHALDTLLLELTSGAPPAHGSSRERLGDIPRQIAEGAKLIDDMEPLVESGIADMRRAAPSAIFPERPMAPRIAKRFGDFVHQKAREGLDLSGRDLAGVDLAGIDLSGANLAGAFLERANLARARLRGADLSGAVLTEARLEEADLSDANLTGANLSRVRAHRVRLDRARSSGGLLMEADLSSSTAIGVVLTDMQFMEADLTDANFTEARLLDLVLIKVRAPGLRLDRASVRQCQWLECDLSGARMDGAHLDRCAFIRLTAPGLRAVSTDLRHSSFLGGAQLAAADFSDALLSDASFFGADLEGARFRRSVGDRALFCEARIGQGDFRLASLRRTLFDNAQLNGADFAGAQMMEAQLHRAELTGAFFRRASLFGADLSDAMLAGADFTGANLLNSPLALETTHG